MSGDSRGAAREVQRGMTAHADLFPGQWQPQVVLMAALEVGLIEALLERPRPAAEVARDLALDERATLRVVRVLVDAGYLDEQDGGSLAVAPEVRPFLDAGDEAYAGDRLLHFHGLLARWVQLPEVLRHGSRYRPDSSRTPRSCSELARTRSASRCMLSWGERSRRGRNDGKAIGMPAPIARSTRAIASTPATPQRSSSRTRGMAEATACRASWHTPG